jgi:hypothetical protein
LHSDRQYCSGRCRTRLYRANKAKEAAARAPARQAMLARLERVAPKTAGLVNKLRVEAGDDCTELIIKAALQAVDELGPLRQAALAKRQEGQPMR